MTEVSETSETARSEIVGAVVSPPPPPPAVISTPVEPVQVVGDAPPESSETWTVQLSGAAVCEPAVALMFNELEPAGAIDEPPAKVASDSVFDEFQPPALPPFIVKLVLGLEILTQRMVWAEVLLTEKAKRPVDDTSMLVCETVAVQEETAAPIDLVASWMIIIKLNIEKERYFIIGICIFIVADFFKIIFGDEKTVNSNSSFEPFCKPGFSFFHFLCQRD